LAYTTGMPSGEPRAHRDLRLISQPLLFCNLPAVGTCYEPEGTKTSLRAYWRRVREDRSWHGSKEPWRDTGETEEQRQQFWEWLGVDPRPWKRLPKQVYFKKPWQGSKKKTRQKKRRCKWVGQTRAERSFEMGEAQRVPPWQQKYQNRGKAKNLWI